jgi:hypothetical protein
MNSIEQQYNPPQGEMGDFVKRWNDSNTHQGVEKTRTPIRDREYQHHVNIPVTRVQDLIRVAGMLTKII